MNPIGIHAGVWVGDWTPASAEYAISESARAGFDLIEIPVRDPRTTDLALTRRLLADNGLDAVVSLALGENLDINTEDAEASDRGERMLEDAVTFARGIGAPYIGGVLYSKMAKYTHAASAASRDNSLAVLRRVAAKAGDAGIRLGMEYVNRYESNLLNTAGQTVEFIHDLGADNVLLHLDTFHANLEEPDQATAVRDAGELLGYVHAAENHRGYLGSGSVDWPGLFRQLVLSGYTGPITFESFSSDVVGQDTADDIGLWRNLWDDPADLARSANLFLRSNLETARRACVEFSPRPLSTTG
ncbi:sugar phosphate isomerase/epimerase family protein [Mycetocola miduiensis]|uniref:sugar phosphate isomerase/epimerase family protein n=1 Tax=Mycetocola miduiensis TaxID=995034 RepID=UPI000B859FF6|nr:sugar phosphate isomerase/epimerase [Mycetocola miduiensis]